MNELISVIISVYNIENYLLKCFETIAKQTYRNLEIILVDDGSTDKSAALCDTLASNDARVKVIHQKNQGASAARNSGKRIATGNYFFFVDGDDYVHLEAIQVMYEAINSGPGYDMAMINRKKTISMDEDITTHCNHLDTSDLSSDALLNGMINHPDKTLFVLVWNKLYRRELIDNIWYNPYKKTQDFDFNFRVGLQLKKAIWIHQPLYYYVQRPGSLCHYSRAWEVYYQCRTDILFNNYVNLPADKQQYKHLLLSDLYPYMLHHLGERISSSEWGDVARKCLRYEQVVGKDLWNDKNFSLWQKIEWTCMVRSSKSKLVFKLLVKMRNLRGKHLRKMKRLSHKVF